VIYTRPVVSETDAVIGSTRIVLNLEVESQRMASDTKNLEPVAIRFGTITVEAILVVDSSAKRQGTGKISAEKASFQLGTFFCFLKIKGVPGVNIF